MVILPFVQANGIAIHYEVRGSGLPALFLHGSGASWKMWEPQIDDLSKRLKMIMVDYRGHGESSKEFPNETYDFHLIVDDIKAFLDRVELSKVVVIGVSQGGVLATLFSIKYPDYVSKLVISNSYSEIPTKVAGWILAASNFVFSLLPYRIIIRLMMQVYKRDPYTQQVLQNSFSINKKMLLMMKRASFPAHTEQLSSIKVPTLVMGGAGKVVTGIDEGKAARLIYERIPDARLVLVEGAFDPLSTMRKDVFNDVVMSFLADEEIKHYQGVIYESKATKFEERDTK